MLNIKIESAISEIRIGFRFPDVGEGITEGLNNMHQIVNYETGYLPRTEEDRERT